MKLDDALAASCFSCPNRYQTPIRVNSVQIRWCCQGIDYQVDCATQTRNMAFVSSFTLQQHAVRGAVVSRRGAKWLAPTKPVRVSRIATLRMTANDGLAPPANVVPSNPGSSDATSKDSGARKGFLFEVAPLFALWYIFNVRHIPVLPAA